MKSSISLINFYLITLNLNTRVSEVHELNLVLIAMYYGRRVAFQEMENSLHLQEAHRSDCVIDLKMKEILLLIPKLLTAKLLP